MSLPYLTALAISPLLRAGKTCPPIRALGLCFALLCAVAHATAQNALPPTQMAAKIPAPTVLIEKHPGMRALAKTAAQGDDTLETAYLALLETAVYQQSIIDAISKPAEGKPWKDYRPIFMTPTRISAGVKFWRENQAALTRAEAQYQVPAKYIVAIIGVETLYGANVGKYRVLDALTTLALYYPPRSEFFAGELRQFLQFSQNSAIKIDPKKALGSYAGAMGLGQFIPTSYVKFAVDGDADGTIDLWQNNSDITASVANYFNVHGWLTGQPVVARTRIAQHARAVLDTGVLPSTTVKALGELGYRPIRERGTTKISPAAKASMIVLEGALGPEHFIGFQNFYVITRYNRSPLYAMAVHQLAGEIAAEMQRTQ
jgi:membrane-bound lytic murein transglycosylase B